MANNSNNVNKPKILYRGVCIDYNILKTFQFFGVPLTPPNEFLIDSMGRKTVGDGNEYGVYMSDNETMVELVYGNVHRTKIKLNGAEAMRIHENWIELPQVGIVYEIDTNNLDIRRPFIVEHLKAHYNNGFSGNEWITDIIPEENYRITKIVVGSDLLHDKELISTEDIEKAEQQTKRIMEERKLHLEALVKELGKYSDNEIRNFGLDELEILIDIFGNDGVCYSNSNDISVSTATNGIKYLMASIYESNKDSKIDFQSFRYLENLKHKLLKLRQNGTLKDEYFTLFSLIVSDINLCYAAKKLSILKELLEILTKKMMQEDKENQSKSVLMKYQKKFKDFSESISDDLFKDIEYMKLLDESGILDRPDLTIEQVEQSLASYEESYRLVKRMHNQADDKIITYQNEFKFASKYISQDLFFNLDFMEALHNYRKKNPSMFNPDVSDEEELEENLAELQDIYNRRGFIVDENDDSFERIM